MVEPTILPVIRVERLKEPDARDALIAELTRLLKRHHRYHKTRSSWHAAEYENDKLGIDTAAAIAFSSQKSPER